MKYTTEERLKIFEVEIGYIRDENLKQSAINFIEVLPEYFFEVGASSTGKYHPSYSIGELGLVRHTKSAIRIAKELERCSTVTGQYMPFEIDMAVFALMFHDSLKHGLVKQKYSVANHPNVANDWLDMHRELFKADELAYKTIQGLIASHMGEWNTDWKTKREIMPKPQTSLERFVHLCDYLASRKCLEVPFEDDNYTIKGKVEQ